MPNPLVAEAGLKLGPTILETLVKHYIDRMKKSSAKDANGHTQLRQDELLYDQAFSVVKKFFEAAAFHTVEDMQAFSNTRTPSPPWVHTVRVIIPMSCCDEAADHLIRGMGGEEMVKRLVGGTKWWQVRGIDGIDAEWVTARKDWQEAKRRYKEQQKQQNRDQPVSVPPQADQEPPASSSEENNVYNEDMDDTRCILYSHGGGYYFGSLDQERYSIQRHARKINGRVFAINYRLSPQYPFPCALQDILAAYLYLIKPPKEASHRPVKPSNLVVAGDSAGGGLIISLLQTLRDTGLPLPAGGVLISPWCDLTHSFPSVHTNTATDVIPEYGMSMQKPSALWPPPSDDFTRDVHSKLRDRIRQIGRMSSKGPAQAGKMHLRSGSKFSLAENGKPLTASEMPINVGTTAALPPVGSAEDQMIRLVAKSGEELVLQDQVHLYAQNSMLGHPLISPVLSYMGGLPPLLIIASEKEVLRDEIIYTAHRAAYPSRFPIREEARELYPALVGIEERYGPTPVHLQVYDDAAHVLPVLFAFTTPGKFCYRAIATFIKHVTGLGTLQKSLSIPDVVSPPMTPTSPNSQSSANNGKRALSQSASMNDMRSPDKSSDSTRSRRSFRAVSRASTLFRGNTAPAVPTSSSNGFLSVPSSSSDVGGARHRSSTVSDPGPAPRTAGVPSVYDTPNGPATWKEGMIRERVSTQGVIRDLEPEAELDAFHVPPDIIGVISELAVRRYLDGKAKYSKKFQREFRAIEKQRQKNLELAKKDVTKNMEYLQNSETVQQRLREGDTAPDSWLWAWTLDDDERPPPSSIVSRRDTDEARSLARIADQAVLQTSSAFSANSLWTVMVNFLTVSPGKEKPARSKSVGPPARRRSLFSLRRGEKRTESPEPELPEMPPIPKEATTLT